MITIGGPHTGPLPDYETILRALPGWFGIEEATKYYIEEAAKHPTFVARDEGKVIGFLTLLEHTAYAAEIHVMGVVPDYHRRGAGRLLVHAAEGYLRKKRVRFLQVKTLSDRHPDEGYKKTRAFYLAVGFLPLQEFPDLWGEANPCLQLVKAL